MKTSFDWIFFDCFNTLIDDFTTDGDESGLGAVLDLPANAGFYTTGAEFKIDYDRWKRDTWDGTDWREVELTHRLKDILTKKNGSRTDAVDTFVDRMIEQFDGISGYAETYTGRTRDASEVAS